MEMTLVYQQVTVVIICRTELDHREIFILDIQCVNKAAYTQIYKDSVHLLYN